MRAVSWIRFLFLLNLSTFLVPVIFIGLDRLCYVFHHLMALNSCLSFLWECVHNICYGSLCWEKGNHIMFYIIGSMATTVDEDELRRIKSADQGEWISQPVFVQTIFQQGSLKEIFWAWYKLSSINNICVIMLITKKCYFLLTLIFFIQPHDDDFSIKKNH